MMLKVFFFENKLHKSINSCQLFKYKICIKINKLILQYFYLKSKNTTFLQYSMKINLKLINYLLSIKDKLFKKLSNWKNLELIFLLETKAPVLIMIPGNQLKPLYGMGRQMLHYLNKVINFQELLCKWNLKNLKNNKKLKFI